jgi:type IV secretion system protein VirD4
VNVRKCVIVSIGVAAAIAAIPLWLLAASRLFMLLDSIDGIITEPWTRATAWWVYAHSEFAARPSVKMMLAGSAVLPILPVAAIVGMALYSPRARKKLRRQLGGQLRPIEAGVTDNHGHAHWPSVEEMLKRFSGPAQSHGGKVVGEARRIDLEPVKDIPFDNQKRSTWGRGGKAELLIDDCNAASPHSLMFVGTGGNKTMHMMATQYHWRGSTVTFDPSCEIGPMIKRWRQKIGQRVVFLGSGEFKGSDGRKHVREGIDVLACINPGTPDATSRILSMTASMCGEEPGRKDSNSIFDSAGRNIIACLLAHMMYSPDNPDQPKTLQTLVEGLNIPEKEMQDFMDFIQRESNSSLARRLARSLMATHKETFSGAYFNASQMVGYLFDDETLKLLSGPNKPADILAGNVSIYVQIPTSTLINPASAGIGRLIVDSIVCSVISADGNYAERMLLHVDEAALLGPMKSLQVVLKQARKYGLAMQLIYTSRNDAKTIWTDDGLETWLDGVAWSGYAAVSSRTAEILSKEMGKHGVMAYSEGTNSGSSGKGLGGASSSRGRNTNVHEISRSLITPDEFKDSRSDELFVVTRTGRAIRCGMAPYYRRPEMAAEIDRSPYYKGPSISNAA